MKVCPKCGRVISYNSYFDAYICDRCTWEDATIERRHSGVVCYRITSAGAKLIHEAQTVEATLKQNRKRIVVGRKMGVMRGG